ncbi:hypothetical protein FACS189427_06680 [Planctomycetales bacterium]|nr:hypothetical protein FACS189427_06680 [Planctomycetales bacterium]
MQLKRLLLKLFFSFCFCSYIFTAPVFAADYYVDSQTGNDAADGKTPQSAWQSLKKVNSADIQAGDKILFKRNCQWRGQLLPKSGTEGKEVVYSAYGETGSNSKKPSFLGSVPLNQESDWLPAGNNTNKNIWASKESKTITGKETLQFKKLDRGIHQEKGAKVKLSQKKENDITTYTLNCSASGTKSNHIQFIVHGFTVEEDKYYLLRFAAKSTVPAAEFSVRLSESVPPWGGLGTTVKQPARIESDWKEQEVLFQCSTSHKDARITFFLGGVLPKDSELSFKIIGLYKASVDTTGINTDVGNIILNGSKAGFKRWTLEDLKQQDDFWYDNETARVYFYSEKNPALLYQSIEAALHRHIVSHNNCQYVIFDGLDLRYGGAHGFGGTKAQNCIYRNLDISWIGGADQYLQGGKGRRVRFGNGIEFWADASDNLVENCNLWEIYDAALTNQGAGVNVEKNITYRNNTIWNSEYSFEYWNRGPESKTENIVFENNLCFNAGSGWGHIQRPDKNGRHIMFYSNTAQTKDVIIRNNVFDTATESLVRIDVDFRGGLSFRNNKYWQQDGGDYFYYLIKKKYKAEQFGEYQKETGLDADSVIQKTAGSRTR